jgi:hypothetical protein
MYVIDNWPNRPVVNGGPEQCAVRITTRAAILAGKRNLNYGVPSYRHNSVVHYARTASRRFGPS